MDLLERIEMFLGEVLDEDRKTRQVNDAYRIAAMEGNTVKYVKKWHQFSDMTEVARAPLVDSSKAMSWNYENIAQKFCDKLNAISKRKGKEKFYVEKTAKGF